MKFKVVEVKECSMEGFPKVCVKVEYEDGQIAKFLMGEGDNIFTFARDEYDRIISKKSVYVDYKKYEGQTLEY